VEEVTIKLHLRRIYRKIGVSNRTQAVKLAMANGIG
jgi:ATP/maltotriose-dependent transcriptional regulator MalT